MQRLASGGEEVANDTGNSENTDTGKTFTCSDGITMIPYEVMGTQELEGKNNNFVVMHDFFDTYEYANICYNCNKNKNINIL